MPTRNEVWTTFKPKLAEAREKDRATVALSFLPLIVPLGRFEIVPLTIEKLLWLEQIESPFINGKPPRREDVLAFLWICSPQFRVGEKYGKRFCWKNCFINWERYAQLVAEYVQEVCKSLGGKSDQGAMDSNWLPSMVDAFASQYHWTAEQIMSMPVTRATMLVASINARVSEKPTPTFNAEADRVRHEMLRAMDTAKDQENGK